MKHVHATWYRLEDGTQADPDDVSPDEKGVLRHKNGTAVAIRGNGAPLTSGARDKQAPASRDLTADAGKPAAKDREMKAADDGKVGYRTRGSRPAFTPSRDPRNTSEQ